MFWTWKWWLNSPLNVNGLSTLQSLSGWILCWDQAYLYPQIELIHCKILLRKILSIICISNGTSILMLYQITHCKSYVELSDIEQGLFAIPQLAHATRNFYAKNSLNKTQQPFKDSGRISSIGWWEGYYGNYFSSKMSTISFYDKVLLFFKFYFKKDNLKV